jgi:hypothetical protein
VLNILSFHLKKIKNNLYLKLIWIRNDIRHVYKIFYFYILMDSDKKIDVFMDCYCIGSQ